MSAGPATIGPGPQTGGRHIAGSATVVGRARLGQGSLVAQGAVIRSRRGGVEVETGSAVLENSVVVGTVPSGSLASGVPQSLRYNPRTKVLQDANRSVQLSPDVVQFLVYVEERPMNPEYDA